MVWGCFWGDGRCDLYVMDRDFESKKHGYSAVLTLTAMWNVLEFLEVPWGES